MEDSISIFRELCNRFEDLVRTKDKIKDAEGAFHHFSIQKENKKFKQDIEEK